MSAIDELQQDPNEYAFSFFMSDGRKWVGSPGMSLRDYFAAKALQGWIGSLVREDMDGTSDDPRVFAEHQAAVAQAAYGYADAMLAARSA